nr:D-Ala-D-Ala carboxypeptidase family metallohydrolase [Rhizobium sp. BK251]
MLLGGCVSTGKGPDEAAPAASDTTSVQETSRAVAADGSAKGYRDPLVTNVAGTAPQQTAQTTPPLPGSAATAPASIAGLAMQPTGVNAQAMSIFSTPGPAVAADGSGAATGAIAPQAASPARINPTSSSVYSTTYPPSSPAGQKAAPPPPSPNSPSPGPQAAAEPTGGNSSRLSGGAMTALYSAPRPARTNFLAGLLQKASLPGVTRVAPKGLHMQTDEVQVSCFKPGLLAMIKNAEAHFGRAVVVTSGYRDENHNRAVGGADESLHKSCDAADIRMDGVSKWDLASYIRSLPGRGGVGTYCNTEAIHLDTGTARDWNRACRSPFAGQSAGRGV